MNLLVTNTRNAQAYAIIRAVRPYAKKIVASQKKTPVDPFNPPLVVKELIQSHKESYLNGKAKTFNPYFYYLFQDPLVSILWWCQFSVLALKTAKQLGR